MIVDCHTHLWRSPGELSDELLEETFIMRRQKIDMDVKPEDHRRAMEPVDRAIVFGMRAPLTGFLTKNETVAEYVRTDPEKLIGFASVDPTESGAADEVDRAVEELGLRGLKLTPIYGGWHPTCPEAWAVYERADHHQLPMLFHQGATFPRKAPLKYARPAQLEDIALKYPELRIIVAHIGHPWEAETIVMIRKQPHMYADISGLFYRPWQFYNSLRLAVEYGVVDKLLFGTDYPITTFEETVKGLRDIVKLSRDMNLPELPDDLPDRIIHQPTTKLLGLE